MYEKLLFSITSFADAIMNRVVSRAYELTTEGPSMQEGLIYLKNEDMRRKDEMI